MGIYRLPDRLVREFGRTRLHQGYGVAGEGKRNVQMPKAMRGRIALQSTSCEMGGRTLLGFAQALGVRTRPRVALMLRRWALQRQSTNAEGRMNLDLDRLASLEEERGRVRS
jgi:hypothetical protein